MDSHVHLQGLGKFSGDRNLSELTSVQDIHERLQRLYKDAMAEPTLGDKKLCYIQAFGLNLNDQELRTLMNQVLQQDATPWFKSKIPFLFCLVLNDGHRALFFGSHIGQIILENLDTINPVDPSAQTLATQALNTKVGANCDVHTLSFGTQIFKTGSQSALLCGDNLRAQFEKLCLADVTDSPLKQDLLNGQKLLLKKGFSHIRDMTSDAEQFSTLLQLEKDQQFFLYSDLYFSNFKNESIPMIFEEIKNVTEQNTDRIQVKGIKIFLDGSLAGANLDCSCQQLSHIHATYSQQDILEILIKAQQQKIEVAFHCIGDLAFEKIIQAFIKLIGQKNFGDFTPNIHLEHCQFINSKTLAMMVDIPWHYQSYLHFHFQPTHWIDDRLKLPKEALGLHFFAWDKILDLGFKNIHFGSDAPVTPPCFNLDQVGGLAPLMQDKKWLRPWWQHFSHPDYRRGMNTFTLFNSSQGFQPVKDTVLSPQLDPSGLKPPETALVPKVFIDGNLVQH